MTEKGEPYFPYTVIDNPETILDITDLVFIDPVSTGHSHAIPLSKASHFHGVEEDVKSIGEFIRLYITRFGRWQSPKFLTGESYGTTRAVALAGYLHENQHIYLNGMILISSVLNFQFLDCVPGNDLAYLLLLPSYTAAAWYYHKLSPDLQANLRYALSEAKRFALNEYALALLKGNRLSKEEKQRLAAILALYTGLSSDDIEKADLYINMLCFTKKLLKSQKQLIGLYDIRFKGADSKCAEDCNGILAMDLKREGNWLFKYGRNS